MFFHGFFGLFLQFFLRVSLLSPRSTLHRLRVCDDGVGIAGDKMPTQVVHDELVHA